MKILIENAGIIKKAEVNFNGLTVIGGENDTGKSTIGKLMFAIVKAVNRYEQELHEGKEHRLVQGANELYFNILNTYDFEKNNELQKEFLPAYLIKQFSPFLRAGLLNGSLPKDQIEAIFSKKIDLLKATDSKNQNEDFPLDSLLQLIEKIKKQLLQEEDKEQAIKRALTKALVSEFYFEVTPVPLKTGSKIGFMVGNNKILDVEIKNNKITGLDIHDLLPFDDVTFIETPVILQLYDIVRSANTLLELGSSPSKNERLFKYEKPTVSFHIKDLVSKLENAKFFHKQEDLLSDLEDYPLKKLAGNIGDIVNGDFFFNEDERDFTFLKETGSRKRKKSKIKSTNTASGIKSFGIIQLLLKARILDERSLLIIDEPENHLHPRWQIEYAKLLVELVKNNVSVLVATHSPYMLQALKVYSEKNNLHKRVNFYLAEQPAGNSLAEIEDVTDDLNRLFLKLSEPMQELVWKKK